MKLYEIAAAFKDLENLEIDEQTLKDTLEGLQGELEHKSDNIATIIKNCEYMAKAIKEEVGTLMLRSVALEERATRLKDYLYKTYFELGIAKMETPRHKINIRKNPAKVILEEGFNDENYIEELITYKVDKKAIKEELKKGVKIEGAYLQQTERLDVK